MKKQLSTLLLSLITMTALADPITPQRALQIAQNYLIPGNTMTMTHRAKARLTTTQNSPYYIISRGSGKGYVIVAGDDCMPEVLGFTETGDFDSSNTPPALQEMLDCWQLAVEKAQADGTNVTEAKARKAMRKVSANRVDIKPFVSAHWHQSSPYNDNCPTLTSNGNRAVTGCVATATSQVIYYWRKDLPSTLQASTPTYGYGDAPVTRSVPKGTPLKWDIMLDSYGSELQEYKQAVAEFVFATGAATWLTYGSSTAGNVEKVPYTLSTYYGMNGGTVHYRDSYTQEAWTQLVYNELSQGRPVIYTGVHPSNGGHCVFIHGYRASDDLMYFNFGWGGQSDGYYTTDQTTGMNGFCAGQSALIGAYPKSWNRTATITAPVHTYAKIDNSFTVKVENNSTFDLQGVYIFASTSSSKPTDLSKACSSDTETIFQTGTTKTIQLTVKPTSAKTTYITLTDAELNVISTLTVEAESADADVSFVGVDVEGSSLTTEKDGNTFTNIYNDSKAVVNINVNNTGSSDWGGYGKADIYCLNESSGEWELFKTQINTKAEVKASAYSTVEFTVTGLETNKYYYATCADEWGIATSKIAVDTSNPLVGKAYFILQGADMAVEDFENNVLTLSGHFDNMTFNTSKFATMSTYKTATVYDLRQCTGVKTVSQDINPNALYYVSDDSEAAGQNIVTAGTCDYLSLKPGYNFAPLADFTAKRAELSTGDAVAKWQLITVPFNATIQDGTFAREDTLYRSGLKTVDVTTLEAGKTYLVMASSLQRNYLVGENTTVLASPLANKDASIIATYSNTTTPAGAMLINDDEKQYFAPVDEGTAVEALRGYFSNSAATSKFRAYTNVSLDPAYAILAQDIAAAYDILDQYANIVTEEAYNTYHAEILEAEKVFTERSITAVLTVKDYAATLLADGDTYMKQIKDVGNTEVDFTNNITNPSFETKSATGWTVGTKEGVTTVYSVFDGTQANNNRAVGLDGTYVFQSLIASADSTSVGIQQQVTNLTPGYYRVTAKLGTDEHSTVTMFAGDSTVVVQGHAFGHLYLSKAIINNVRVTADPGSETGSLLIGVQAGRWYKADNFTLTYVGSIKGKEEEDAITDINATSAASRGIYTMQGVRVSNADRQGMYIIDGKKVVVK